MEIIRLPRDMSSWAKKHAVKNKRIALVPTMGYFHEGHLSLMRTARQKADSVVVSLFVNPIQFGPQEDLARYPTDVDRDAALAEAEQVDALFVPHARDMYPGGSQTRVIVGGLTDTLCGKSRPGHFEGVTTVVAKLFNIVKPQVAVFGQKDFQQLAVIRKMVRDLKWDIEIAVHPIVREADGLAMSSRNIYLSQNERQSALSLYKMILVARKRVREGLRDAGRLVEELKQMAEAAENVEAEYVFIIDRESLSVQSEVNRESVLALAVRVGNTRLIDNDILFAGD